MEIEEIKALIASLEESKLSKLFFKKGDMEIRLEKETYSARYAPRPPLERVPEASFQAEESMHGERGGVTAPSAPKEEAAGDFVTSPMVGTFYTSSGPDQPAFVKVGDRVDENTVVCIVEAMKLMNEVKAGVKGQIAEILIDNAEPVEFGTRLFRIQV